MYVIDLDYIHINFNIFIIYNIYFSKKCQIYDKKFKNELRLIFNIKIFDIIL